MDSNWTIRAEGLSKKFGMTLRRSMAYGLKDSLSRLCGNRVPSNVLRSGEFWAVKDVSFELHRGESLGLMGINGSGKTTLLRILNGIFAPDVGQVVMRGRVGALVAVGAGFSPMLTGRENIYVNGALLGLGKRDIDRKLDEILAFADIGAFIDSPVKHYSSGMVVRLGFAVAAMCEPEILLIDEVLAVGDINFQKKCYDYLHRLKRDGTSIILVSHSVGAIWAICDKGLLLHEGQVRSSGSVEDVLRAYSDLNARIALGRTKQSQPLPGFLQSADPLPTCYGGQKGGTGEVVVHEVTIGTLKRNGTQDDSLEFGESIAIEATIDVRTSIVSPIFRFTVDAMHYKYVASVDSFEQDLRLKTIAPGKFVLRVDIPRQNLMPGSYVLNMAVCKKGVDSHLFFWFGAASFQILHPRDKFLYSEANAVVYLGGEFSLTELAEQKVSGSMPVESRAVS
ncbi:MAG: ABC transporter ATP-binding protein [Nitrospirota bacterium]